MSIFEKLLSPLSVTHMYVCLKLFTRIGWLNKGLVFVKDWVLLSQQPLIDCICSSMIGEPHLMLFLPSTVACRLVLSLDGSYCGNHIVELPWLYLPCMCIRHYLMTDIPSCDFYNFSPNLLQSFLSFMYGERILLLYQLKVGGQLFFIFASFRFL